MLNMRYKPGYVYVFEGARPGSIGFTIHAYEVEVEPGKWKTVAPFVSDPTNPAMTMGKRWLAKAGEETVPLTDVE